MPVGTYLSKLPQPSPAREIGSRRELFLDEFLIERLDNATLKLHEPAKTPRPRSPLIGGYATVIKDGELFCAVYRSYDPSYKGEQYDGNRCFRIRYGVALREADSTLCKNAVNTHDLLSSQINRSGGTVCLRPSETDPTD